jgi:hypothetical protein
MRRMVRSRVDGHLGPDSLCAESDRLSFGISPTASKGSPESKGSLEVGKLPGEGGAPWLQSPENQLQNANGDSNGLSDSDDLNLWARRDSNPLPPASEAGTLSR